MAGNASSLIANWTLLDFDYGSDCTRAAGFWRSYYDNGWNAFVSLKNCPYAQFIDFVQHAAPDPSPVSLGEPSWTGLTISILRSEVRPTTFGNTMVAW
jgi:hypothetical protein